MTLGCSFLRLISDHYDDDDDDGEDDAHVHDSLMDAMLRIFYSNIGDNHHVQNLGVFVKSTCRGMKEKYVNRLEGIFRAPWRSSKFQKSSHHFTSVKTRC